MRHSTRHFIAGLVSAALLTACSRTPLEKVEILELASIDNEFFATDKADQFSLPTKILFVVDQSGSNVSATATGPATDPVKKFRGDTMNNFFQRYKSRSNISWGLISFAGSTARSLIPQNTEGNKFFSETNDDFDQAFNTFKGTGDNGGTPYVAALGVAQSAIQAEADKNPNAIAQYLIFFFSDGFPSGDTEAAILTSIDNLKSVPNAKVSVSTVFYGTPVASAQNLLRKMAQQGGGIYSDTNVSTDINVDDILSTVSFRETFVIKEMAVYNLTSTTCFDGSMDVDSDADGLCDRDEDSLNIKFKERLKNMGMSFSATNARSFNAGYKDIFYWRFLEGQTLPICNAGDMVDEDGDMLNVCEEKFLVNTTPSGPTDDWTDGMKKAGASADAKNFDTDGDGMLDFLEFAFFKDKSTASDYIHSVASTNGNENKYLFMNHLGLFSPRKELAYGAKLYKRGLSLDGQGIYEFKVDQVPLYNTQAVSGENAHEAGENLVLVYAIVVPESAPFSKGELRQTIQRVKAGTKNIHLNIKTLFPADF